MHVCSSFVPCFLYVPVPPYTDFPFQRPAQIGGPATLNGCASVLNTKLLTPLCSTCHTLSCITVSRCVLLPLRLSTYRSMYQEGVFQHFRKEKAVLEIIETTPTSNVDILQFCISTANSTSTINCQECIPGPVSVHLVSSGSVSVVHALEIFGTEYVVAGCDVEPRLLVEGFLISRWRRVVRVSGRS